ncbi:MAG: hypothetical protein ACYSUQ_12665 [Planctomycetota bacterium]
MGRETKSEKYRGLIAVALILAIAYFWLTGQLEEWIAAVGFSFLARF